MKTTIDRAGRIVVPKTLRARLGLRAGQEVDIHEQGHGLSITPTAPTARLVSRPDGPVIVPVEGAEADVLTDSMVRELMEASRR